ncbi:MAG: type 4a pilus biogenesis protein PilO [Deltaproteobacteria bacterium]|nr:type 4a pilus biogenesis protein PilO [Deltaproteobacteria bacterium]
MRAWKEPAAGLLKGPYLYIVFVFVFILAINGVITVAVTARQKEEIRLLEEKVASLSRRAALKTNIPEDIGTFEKRLPDSKGLTKVIGDVFSAAKKNGLAVPAGDYSPETSSEAGFSRYTVSFPVEGRYPEIKKFIYDLETLKHPVVIEEIAFSRSKKSEGTIELRLRLSVYFI